MGIVIIVYHTMKRIRNVIGSLNDLKHVLLMHIKKIKMYIVLLRIITMRSRDNETRNISAIPKENE